MLKIAESPVNALRGNLRAWSVKHGLWKGHFSSTHKSHETVALGETPGLLESLYICRGAEVKLPFVWF